MTIYASRWSIEVHFRGWKDSYHFKSVLQRTTNEHAHRALILAAMIAHQLTLKLWNRMHRIAEHKGKLISLEKLISSVADYLSEITDIAQLSLYDPDIRHICYESRSRKPLMNKHFMSLT